MQHNQPPLMRMPLCEQINRLKEEARLTTTAPITPITARDQQSALEESIRAWMSSLTPEQLKRRYSTIEIIALAKLTGRFKDLPALQQVACILRKLGFEHKRSWRNGTYNKRYFIYKKTIND